MMTIKQKRIYHCSTKSAVREFLTLAKKQGYVWKNDREIDVDRDISIYDTYEAETCFKTNTGKLSFGAMSGYQEKEPDRKIDDFLEFPKFDKIYTSHGSQKTLIKMVHQLYKDGYKAVLQGAPLTPTDVLSLTTTAQLSDGSPRVIAVDTENKIIRLSTENRMRSRGFDGFDDLEINLPTLPPIGSIVKIKGEQESSDNVYMLLGENDDLTGTVYNQGCYSKRVAPENCILVDESEASDDFKKIAVGDLVAYKCGIFRVTEKKPLYISVTTVYAKEYISIVSLSGKCILFYNAPIRVLDENDKTSKYKVGDVYKINSYYYKITDANSIFVSAVRAGNTSVETWTTVDFECKNPTRVEYTPFNPNPDAVVMPESELGDLCDKAVTVFKEHGYDDATHDGVMAWLKKWNKSKGWLASILRQHHAWDEKNLCVSDIFEEERTTTESKRWDAVLTFANWVYRNSTDRTLYNILCSGDSSFCTRCKSVTSEFKERAEKFISGAKVSVGAKYTRAIRQLCGAIGLTKCDDFEKQFATLSDAFSDGKVKRRYCLSINPLDFLLMSNGNSWSSCHFLEYGNSNKCYQAGTMSYPMDKVTMILFTIDNIKGDGDFYTYPKLHRQLFMYSSKFLMQSRLYPTWSDKAYSALTRDTVRGIIDECEGNKDKDGVWGTVRWNVESGSRKFFVTAPKSLHYPDYVYDYNINIVPKADASIPDYYEDVNPFELPEIGGTIVCPKCGKEHNYNSHCCYCNECHDRYY